MKLEATYLSRCHQLGIQSLGLHQAGDTNSLLLAVWHFQCSQDDLVSDDLPSVELETEEEEIESIGCEEVQEEDGDVDEVDPFSEDSNSDVE